MDGSELPTLAPDPLPATRTGAHDHVRGPVGHGVVSYRARPAPQITGRIFRSSACQLFIDPRGEFVCSCEAHPRIDEFSLTEQSECRQASHRQLC